MDIKKLYNDNLRKLSNEYGDVSVMAAMRGFLEMRIIHRCWAVGIAFRTVIIHHLSLLRSTPTNQEGTQLSNHQLSIRLSEGHHTCISSTHVPKLVSPIIYKSCI